jgi:ABC-type nitrate/sulfonate/bicarbonate transport system substrate-binding protein
MRRRQFLAGAAGAAALPSIARAQPAGTRPAAPPGLPKIVIGMSGWTGFAPLSLAERAGLFYRRGVDVEIRFVAQRERHLAMASGALQAIATTVDTQISYAASGVALSQVLVLDKSNGGDGIAARPAIANIAGLRGKQVGCDGPGTTPYFMLAYVLKQNNMSVRDVNLVPLEAQPAAQAFVAGQNDAAVTYEPYLSQIRAMGDQARILVTTIDYPGGGRRLFRRPRHDRERARPRVRDHGRRGAAERAAVRRLGAVHPVAGPRHEPGVFRERPAPVRRSRRPGAARDRRDPPGAGPRGAGQRQLRARQLSPAAA